MRKFLPKHFEGIPTDAQRVFKGELFDVYQWEQVLFDGSTKPFEMLRRPDTVKVLAVKEDKIVLLEEEQPGRGVFFSLPGGRHDGENESESEAAQRELLEETGMRFEKWKLLKVTQPQSKIDWVVYIFLATGFIDQVPPHLDAGERIKVLLKTIDEIRTLNADANALALGDGLLERVGTIQELLALTLGEGEFQVVEQ